MLGWIMQVAKKDAT